MRICSRKLAGRPGRIALGVAEIPRRSVKNRIAMFDGNFRPEFDKRIRPVGVSLKRKGISADHLTALGLVMAIGAAAAIYMGRFPLALLLVVCTGIPDLLDGAVAKASGTAGPRGAFFDSVVDRITDSLLFGSLALWYGRHNPDFLWVPVAALASAMWVSYIRSKAESLGFDARGGVAERAERFVIFCLALLFPSMMTWLVGLIVVLSLITVVQRFVKVWKQASAVQPVPVATPKARRQPRQPRRTTPTLAERRQQRADARARRLDTHT